MSAPAVRAIPAERVIDVDYYELPGQARDFHRAWKDLQDRAGPFGMIWTNRSGGHWIATRAGTIQEVLSDPARFSSYRMTIPRGTDRSGRWDVLPISLDPPEHAPYRSLLNAGLSPRVIKEREGGIRESAVALIEGLQPRGACEFVADYAAEFPIRMVFIIMDLPYADKDRMMVTVNALTQPDGSMTVAQIVQAFADYLSPYIRARRATPGTDLISHIANGRIGDRPITEEEAVQMCVQTFAAGLESVRNALSFIMASLAADAALQDGLRADPGRIPSALNELLRRFSLTTMAREVVADLDFDGVRLARGDLIACPAQLVGLDEQQNPCPMTIDLDRKRPVSVAFGAGPHFCAGKWLADVELRITLQEWLARIPPFRIAPGAQVTHFGGLLGGIAALPLQW